MTASKRLALTFPVLLLALAISMIAASTSFAAEGNSEQAAYCQETQGEGEGCPADQCPAVEGYQYSTASCPTPEPTPTPTPAPTPTPTDVCADVDGVQTDISQCPIQAEAPAVENEVSSLTIETAQHDPAATIGGERTIAAAATAVGGGTSAATTTVSGDLPYTGSPSILVAILAVSLLWIGGAAWMIGSALQRRAARATMT